MTTNCPNCEAIWNLEEIYSEECLRCGYPDHIEEEIDSDDLDDDYFEEGVAG